MLFFDEIDALAPIRISGDRLGTDRIVSQLLLEMDNIMNANGLIVIAATNRPDRVDPALMRAGRFDFILELPLPNCDERREIFKIHTASLPLAADINLDALAECTEGITGSDIETICKHAAMLATKRFTKEIDPQGYDFDNFLILKQDFVEGLAKVVRK